MHIRNKLVSNVTATVSAIGPNLLAAATNCIADQACIFSGVRRFEIVAARRISTSFIVPIEGHEGKLGKCGSLKSSATSGKRKTAVTNLQRALHPIW
jgi:hypothetical protein